MNVEHCETALEPRERHQISNHSLMSQVRNLTVDDPEIIQRIQEFHSDLTAIHNTLNATFIWNDFLPSKLMKQVCMQPLKQLPRTHLPH